MSDSVSNPDQGDCTCPVIDGERTTFRYCLVHGTGTAIDATVERHNALAYARAHLKTHIAWRDYLRAGGELPHDRIGDLEHQEKAIAELNTICKALRDGDRYLAALQWLADAAVATDEATADEWAVGFIQRLAEVGVAPSREASHVE